MHARKAAQVAAPSSHMQEALSRPKESMPVVLGVMLKEKTHIGSHANYFSPAL